MCNWAFVHCIIYPKSPLLLYRQQRAAKAQQPKADAVREVIVAYASQTGTAHEIAKGIQAESASHGIKSQVSLTLS